MLTNKYLIITIYVWNNYYSNGMIQKISSINKNTTYLSKKRKQFFYDENALVIDDPEHSREEERFIILGNSNIANLLVVCHCFRKSESVIRIISARKATQNETKFYYER